MFTFLASMSYSPKFLACRDFFILVIALKCMWGSTKRGFWLLDAVIRCQTRQLLTAANKYCFTVYNEVCVGFPGICFRTVEPTLSDFVLWARETLGLTLFTRNSRLCSFPTVTALVTQTLHTEHLRSSVVLWGIECLEWRRHRGLWWPRAGGSWGRTSRRMAWTHSLREQKINPLDHVVYYV